MGLVCAKNASEKFSRLGTFKESGFYIFSKKVKISFTLQYTCKCSKSIALEVRIVLLCVATPIWTVVLNRWSFVLTKIAPAAQLSCIQKGNVRGLEIYYACACMLVKRQKCFYNQIPSETVPCQDRSTVCKLMRMHMKAFYSIVTV
jgi:hypothetical protein